MKKIVVFILCLALLIPASGCTKQKSPDETVEGFLKAAKSLNLAVMSNYVTPEISETLESYKDLLSQEDLDIEITDSTLFFVSYIYSSAQKMTYTITDTEIEGDKAVVTTDITYVNSLPILTASLGEYLGQAFSLALSGKELTEEESAALFEEILKEEIQNTEETLAQTTVQIQCEKIDDTWYISGIDDTLFNAVSTGLYSAFDMISQFIQEEMESAE